MLLLRRYFLLTALGFVLSFGSHLQTPLLAQQISQNQGTIAMQQGKQHYEAGQFWQALQKWQQAQQFYTIANDSLHEAQTYNLISLAEQQLGEWEAAQQAIAHSLEILTAHPATTPEWNQVYAQALNAQGRLQLLGGIKTANETDWQEAAVTALDTWQAAERLYRAANDSTGILGSQVNQIQAMRSLGRYQQARSLFAQMEQSLAEQPDPTLRLVGLRTLSDLLRQSGQLEEAQATLERALNEAESLGLAQEKSGIFLSLGNIARAQNQTEAAFAAYQAADHAADSFPLLKIQAQLNQMSLRLEMQQWQQAEQQRQTILPLLQTLPMGRSLLSIQVNLAKNWMCLNLRNQAPICPKPEQSTATETTTIPAPISHFNDVIQLLNQSIQQANLLHDRRIESYALGNLGQLYEQIGERQKAKAYTEQALNLAQQIQALDIAYQWQWQLGRLLKGQNMDGAIAAYSEAVKSLQALRRDLVSLDPELQFDFREEVEPVYRQFVALLLNPETPSQNNLIQARQAIEALQLAELNNFFRDACLKTQPEQLDQIIDASTTPTAAFYAIVLPDRLEVILKLPQAPTLHHYRTWISQSQVEQTLMQMRQALQLPRPSAEFPALSQQVYDWLIRPAELDLTQQSIQTLVFVLDFSLQNIAISALDDGEKLLVEKYAIALSPGLQLLEPAPLTERSRNLLEAGVSEARTISGRTFGQLSYVPVELEQIQAIIPNTHALLNDTFVIANLQEQIESTPFSVVHVATHGNFSSNPDDTFILLWDSLLKARQFDQLLQSRNPEQDRPIDLLTLSACQTATGDERATLGLAGIAVRSGTRSTLATLWRVEDVSTADFMVRFYQELWNDLKLTKAEALRRAQLHLLKEHPNTNYRLPYYWAPFVLVGNWQ